MRFLIVESLSWMMVSGLLESGHDAVHVHGLSLSQAADSLILECDRADDRILITQDTDFGTLLATRRLDAPSIVCFRVQETRPAALTNRLLKCIPSIENALRQGPIVVIDDHSIRIRRLPVGENKVKDDRE